MPGLSPLAGAGLSPLGRAGGARSSLLDNLVSWWALDGNGNDSHGANTLSPVATPTYVAGKVGQAASLVAASGQYFSRASNASLQTGDIDFTVVAWVQLASKGANRGIISKAGNNAIEYALRFISANDRFRLDVSSNGTGFTNSVVANNIGAPSLSTWYFIVAWHDSVANTINVQVNDGTANSAAYSSGFIAAGGDFRLGHADVVNWQWDGLIDGAAFWKRVLTATEKTALYASGNGIAYPG